MKRSSTFLNSCLTFSLFSISGIVLGFLTGAIAAGISYTSALSSWTLLESSNKFESIVDATSQTVWAQSEDERLYFWDLNCNREPMCNQWVETKEIPTNVNEPGVEMEKSSSCQTLGSTKTPPGTVVECVSGSYSGPEYGESTYYALLENGKIWALQTSSSLIVLNVLPVLFAFGGLIISLLAFIVYMIIQRRKNKIQGTAEDNNKDLYDI